MKVLVPDWKQFPKWLSVWVATTGAILAGLESTVPALHGQIPAWVYTVFGVSTVIARVLNQPQAEPQPIPKKIES